MDTKIALKSLIGLAHENRLAIFRLLVEQGASGMPAGQIAERLRLPPATTSFHLKELTNAGLVLPRPQSRFIYYSANYGAMNGLIAYLTDNCCRETGACLTTCAPACATAANAADGVAASSRPRRTGKPGKRRVA